MHAVTHAHYSLPFPSIYVMARFVPAIEYENGKTSERRNYPFKKCGKLLKGEICNL